MVSYIKVLDALLYTITCFIKKKKKKQTQKIPRPWRSEINTPTDDDDFNAGVRNREKKATPTMETFLEKYQKTKILHAVNATATDSLHNPRLFIYPQ